MKGKPVFHILYEYQLNVYLTVDSVAKWNFELSLKKNWRPNSEICRAFFRIWPPNFLKGLTQNSIPKFRSKLNSTLILKNIGTLGLLSSIVMNEINCVNIAN